MPCLPGARAGYAKSETPNRLLMSSSSTETGLAYQGLQFRWAQSSYRVTLEDREFVGYAHLLEEPYYPLRLREMEMGEFKRHIGMLGCCDWVRESIERALLFH